MKSVDENGALPHFASEDSSAPNGLLVDHALTLHALLDAYDYTGDAKRLASATKMATITIKTLGDEKDGGFYDIPLESGNVGELQMRDKPLDENSAMATALLRLSWVTGDENFEKVAERTLKLFADDYERYGIMAASYALALELFLNGPIGITILGGKSKEAESFREKARGVYPFRRYILQLDPAKDPERIRKLGYDGKSAPVAYVCVGKVCGPPLKDPSQIESTITSLLSPQQIAAPTQ